MPEQPAFKVGLVGRGIGQSRSPWIHESEASALHLTLQYHLVDFSKLNRADEELEAVVRELSEAGYTGSNITFPFKQAIVPVCDELSEAASVLGAVNTLAFRNGRIIGENTDWVGFSWLIEREFGNIEGAKIAQVGAGGAGSATAYALAKLGAAEVALFDPDTTKAEALSKRLMPYFPDCHFSAAESAEAAIRDRDGIVNATPVGMASVPGLPFPPACMVASQWLADIIYFPLETELLAAARANGQKVANGVSMVVGQAAEAFCIITGHQPDRARMLARMLEVIASEQLQEQAA
jgi:shikimate dehydrogenase